jgi:hypothetical protein
MPKTLYFSTLDYLKNALEVKEAELAGAVGRFRRERLRLELASLNNRLQTELGYLADLARRSKQ